MKISVFTRNLDLIWGEKRYQKCKEFGFDAVDCRLLTTPSDEIYTYSEQKIIELHKHERALADEAGVELIQTHAPLEWPPKEATPEEREKKMDDIKRSLYCSTILGVKLWVVHPLVPVGYKDLTTGGTEITREVNLEFFARLLPIAKECDITVCLENMPWPEFSISSPDEIHEFVNVINDDHFKMCLDTGHNNIHSKGLSAAAQVRAHKDVLRALHVHDNDGKNDQHRMPYDGNADWMDFGKALREIEFSGPYSFETAPSPRLPVPLFEDHLRLQRKIADYILGN